MACKAEDLFINTVSAVRQAAAELRNGYANSRLFGFALCTDDDVRTLYHVACTVEWVREQEASNPDIGFNYVEWSQSANSAQFDLVSQRLASLADQAYASDWDWGAARDRRFDALVLALKECRNSGDFEPETLLCVGSTDPSDHLEALAMHGVDVLNAPGAAKLFARALGNEQHQRKA